MSDDSAKPAAQVEAEGDVADATISLEWEGIEIRLPATVDDWDPDTLELLERGREISTLRALFGSDAYDAVAREFREHHGRKWKLGDVKRLGEVIAKQYGFDQ